MKRCKKCLKDKSFTEFTGSPTTKDRLRNWCKSCFALYDKARRPTLTAEYRKGRSLVRYWPDLSPLEARERYLDLLKEQKGLCKICGNPPTSPTRRGLIRDFNVDHCHTTGKVRGLLCDSCNIGIGLLGDNPALLKQAIIYLERS